MQIGVPKEIKVHEYRVGMIPASVREVVHHGHRVMIETGAGVGFDDDAYIAAGAEIGDEAAAVFAWADMVVKVKEPKDLSFPCWARTRSCLPICTWPPSPTRPRGWCNRAPSPSPLPMKPSPPRAAGCPY